MKPIQEKCNQIIERAIRSLEMNEEAGHKIRFYKLITFCHHQVDNVKDTRLKNPILLTALAYIAWHSTDQGKLEL